MNYVLIIIALIVVAFIGQKINTRLTRCPNCGKMGTSKYLGRLGTSINTKRYTEKYKCKACGHNYTRSRGNNNS